MCALCGEEWLPEGEMDRWGRWWVAPGCATQAGWETSRDHLLTEEAPRG